MKMLFIDEMKERQRMAGIKYTDSNPYLSIQCHFKASWENMLYSVGMMSYHVNDRAVWDIEVNGIAMRLHTRYSDDNDYNQYDKKQYRCEVFGLNSDVIVKVRKLFPSKEISSLTYYGSTVKENNIGHDIKILFNKILHKFVFTQ